MSVISPRSSLNTGFFRCTRMFNSDDSRMRNRDDETAAAIVVFAQVRHDLLGEVPRQQQGIFRHPLRQLLVGKHWNMRSRREASNLEIGFFGNEIERFRADSTVVEQRHALRRSAHRGDAVASLLERS